jgi:predicted nucleic acid-binding Zn ribbon protein
MPTCLNCGNEFKYRFRSSEKFCSTVCCHNYHRKKRRISANKVCVVCGKKLTGQQSKYCSAECRYQAQLQRQRSANLIEYKKPRAEATPPKKRSRPRKKLSIADINKLAREEGLNYGQYVAKYGL